MWNLGEYRKHPQRLADHLPWATLIAPGVMLNKDGSLQKPSRFAAPIWTVQRRTNWLPHARG
jgi:type IV secretion system protein TrbE